MYSVQDIQYMSTLTPCKTVISHCWLYIFHFKLTDIQSRSPRVGLQENDVDFPLHCQNDPPSFTQICEND